MTREENIKNLKDKMKSIRDLLDMDVMDTDIVNIQNKAIKLSQIIGLSAECKAEAKRLLELKKLDILNRDKDKGYPPSTLSKIIDAEASTENAHYIYSDRLNAGISHAIETLRSVISLYKSEMENSLKN